MKNFSTLLKRELAAIGREKTIMFAILIQFVIASLSSILLIGLMAFYDPSSISQNSNAHIRVGLVQEEATPVSGYLAEEGIRVKNYADMPSAKAAFRAGKVDALMQVPPADSGTVEMQLVLPDLDTTQTVVLMSLQEPLKKYENFLRESGGIHLDYNHLTGKPGNSWEFMYSLIVPILMLFPALIAGSIIIDAISEEFQNKTFDTLLATPVSIRQIFSAKVIAAVLTAAFQVFLWVGLLRLNGTVISNPGMVIFFALIAAASISFIAAFVALYFKDRERSQFIYSMVLVVVVGSSTFIGLSPVNIITRLASGSGQTDYLGLGIFALLLTCLGTAFFKFSRTMALRKN